MHKAKEDSLKENSLKLSSDQQSALARLLAWYKEDSKKPFITLGGYAGTGKTTLIAELKKELVKDNKKIKIAFCSYTGRAAQNLKNKLIEANALKWRDTISTIHGLIYDPIENSNEEIIGWMRKEELEKDLIIIDEGSMVDETIWRDLLSYGIPIIAVGDHGQLPPIKGTFNLMEEPNILLTQIHRQAKDNPIIRVSQHARTSGVVPVKKYGGKVIKYDKNDPFSHEISSELLESYSTDTLILCGYNATRTKINHFIRNALGFHSPNPLPGERVICLRNNQKKGVYNGMLGTIKNITEKDSSWYDVEILLDEGNLYVGLIYAPQFGADTAINFTKSRKHANKGDLFDFGYALTVHKAQGSQAKKVILFEERFSKMDDDMWKRWLYTGITRAENELYLFG
jgi:exodeoxyribonuclease V